MSQGSQGNMVREANREKEVVKEAQALLDDINNRAVKNISPKSIVVNTESSEESVEGLEDEVCAMERLKYRVNDFLTKIEELKAKHHEELVKANRRVESIKSENETLREEMKEWEERALDYESQRDYFKKEYYALKRRQRLNVPRHTYSDLCVRQSYAPRRNHHYYYQQRLSFLEDENLKKDNEVKYVKITTNNIIKKYDEIMKGLYKRINDLTVLNTRSVTENGYLNQKVEENAKVKGDMKKTIDILNEDINELRKRNDQLHKENTDLTNDKGELIKKLENPSGLSRLKRKYKVLKEESKIDGQRIYNLSRAIEIAGDFDNYMLNRVRTFASGLMNLCKKAKRSKERVSQYIPELKAEVIKKMKQEKLNFKTKDNCESKSY